MDYQIQPNSRRCAVTGTGTAQPGERFYSVLLEEDRQLVRRIIARRPGKVRRPGAVSFWTGHVVVGNEKVKPRFDDDLLEDCFQRPGRPQTSRAELTSLPG